MPYFDRHIFVCTNARPLENPKGSCATKESERILARFKSELRARGAGEVIRANKSGCLDCCANGPAIVVYPEGVWYQNVSEEDVAEIVEQHILGGQPVKRLIMPRLDTTSEV